MDGITFGVLLISDTCYQEPARDRSGSKLVDLIKKSYTNAQVIMSILPDERDLIQRELRKWVDRPDVRIIITTGGTGFAPRDVTPEATKPLLDKECAQLTLAMALGSFQKSKYAALTRGVCGIAGNTLIINFPGSPKAVEECFDTIEGILPHALHLINDQVELVQREHAEIQVTVNTLNEPPALPAAPPMRQTHTCSHAVAAAAGSDSDRGSRFPMVSKDTAVNVILAMVHNMHGRNNVQELTSPVNIPPFRASVKDGYAIKASSFPGVKKVLGTIAAGEKPIAQNMDEDECYKINTGAPLPDHADCVIQIEDTILLKRDGRGDELLVDIRVQPYKGQDVREVGVDLHKGEKVFPVVDHSPVVIKSLLASVGSPVNLNKPKIAIVSTGTELLAPIKMAISGKIFDSNTTMLGELVRYFGFETADEMIIEDEKQVMKATFIALFKKVDFIICSGGVSMGDKDFIKPILQEMGFDIHFGRVNMKPGKPMTFASYGTKYFFGLPGNPVSAFVTFHLFALPAIRKADGWLPQKSELSIISVKLVNEAIELDARPEFMRASVTSKRGQLFASVSGDQVSSRLQSIVGADVLIHLPARTPEKTHALRNETYEASVLRFDFISHYVS